MRDLEGKVALITGASRGIGAAIAAAFANAGANIAITFRSSAEAANAVAEQAMSLGVEAFAFASDAADRDAGARSVSVAVERFGRLDIIVNNAGIFRRRLLHEASDAEFDEIMAVNVRTVFTACREAVKVMPQGGRIVNIGSSFGGRVPFPGLGLYATSKFALAGMTRALARDLAGKGITVNAIEPGPIATDMNRGDERHARIMSMMTAVGRYGTPQDVANMALFLVKPESGYITGAVFSVDGGFEA